MSPTSDLETSCSRLLQGLLYYNNKEQIHTAFSNSILNRQPTMAPQTTTTIHTDDPMVVIRRRGNAKVMRIDVPLAGFHSDDVIVRPEECRLLILDSKRGRAVGNAGSDDVIIRSVPLPESVDPYTVEAEMHDGILTVEAPMKY